jgi:pimeloyl-ACP methyl ester carboxylesterase
MITAAGIAYTLSSGGETDLPPLLLIHGAGGSRMSWPHEIRRSMAFEVYSIDLPGHGKSPSPGESSIEGFVERIRTFMDAIGVERWIPAGHSMGGAIALTLALQSPDRVAGLVLVGTGARLRVHPDILNMTHDEKAFVSGAEVISNWSFSKGADRQLVDLSTRQLREAHSQTVRADYHACDSFDVMDHLSEVRAPCIVICGAEDRMTPVKYSHYLVDQIPNAEMVVVEDAGHMVMLEKPDVVAGAITDFVRGLFKRGRLEIGD